MDGLFLIICSRAVFILSKHWNEQKRSQRSGARIKSSTRYKNIIRANGARDKLSITILTKYVGDVYWEVVDPRRKSNMRR